MKAPKWFIVWFLRNCRIAYKMDQVRQIEDAYKCYLKGKLDQRRQDKEKKRG